MRTAPIAVLLGLIVMSAPTEVRAQTVVTALVSANMNTSPGFIDLDDAAEGTHAGFGVSVSRLTDGWFGVEGEALWTPSAFSGGDLVESSRLVRASASVLVLAPEVWRLRPYAAIGIGIAQIKSEDVAHLFAVDSTQPVATIGIGAWTWLTPSVGIRASLGFARSLGSVEFGPFETWQPAVGVAIKF
jgi:hypothetical protein